jgi:bifunctional non-homologous end joining protein LigD
MAARSAFVIPSAMIIPPTSWRDESGLAVFDLIRRQGTIANAEHCAFDLLELDGRDLCGEPIEKRKELLAELLSGSQLGLVFNECYEEDGVIVYREACRLGCEGIVSKRLGSRYRSGPFAALAQDQESRRQQ